MTDFAASRFPALRAQEDLPLPRSHGLGLALRLLPLPLGEVSILLAAWLMILPL